MCCACRKRARLRFEYLGLALLDGGGGLDLNGGISAANMNGVTQLLQ